MDAMREVGVTKAVRFFTSTVFLAFFNLLIFPPLRKCALQLAGARVGKGTVIHSVHFFNAYRAGFKGLICGERCFVGDDCLIDLADQITLEDHVTLAERVTILTHTNVGYADHPLQEFFPAFAAPVRLKRGAFAGVNVTILPGVTIGEGTFIAAGSVVTEGTPPWTLVAGAPAKVVRHLKPDAMAGRKGMA